ncbi:MAG: hypothetical protein WD182_07115, partial [Bacteroidota bacterium]
MFLATIDAPSPPSRRPIRGRRRACVVDPAPGIRLWHFLFYPIPVATMVAKPAMGMQDRFAALAALFHQFHSAQNAEKLILLNMREVTTLRAKAVAIYLFVVSVCGH